MGLQETPPSTVNPDELKAFACNLLVLAIQWSKKPGRISSTTWFAFGKRMQAVVPGNPSE
jgi:hypothetical protein